MKACHSKVGGSNPRRSVLFFHRRHASGLVGSQIGYETRESFDGNETANTKVKTWHFSEGETASEDQQNERNLKVERSYRLREKG